MSQATTKAAYFSSESGSPNFIDCNAQGCRIPFLRPPFSIKRLEPVTKQPKTNRRSESSVALIDSLLIQQLKESQQLSSVRGQVLRFFLGVGAASAALMIACALAN